MPGSLNGPSTRSVAGGGEVHVVLGAAGPRAAPAPADRAEGRDHARAHHSAPVAGAVAVGLRRGIAALAAADVGILGRVEVDGESVRVHGPVARPPAAGAGRRNRLAALERGRDVAVAWAAAARPVQLGEADVADREAQPVEPLEDPLERVCGAAVDHERAGVQPTVEAAVGDGEQPQVGTRHRAAAVPEAARPQLRRTRRWERRDREHGRGLLDAALGLVGRAAASLDRGRSGPDRRDRRRGAGRRARCRARGGGRAGGRDCHARGGRTRTAPPRSPAPAGPPRSTPLAFSRGGGSRRPALTSSYAAGWMFWFTRNRLSGSYFALI